MNDTQQFIAVMYGLTLIFLLSMFYIGRTYNKNDGGPGPMTPEEMAEYVRQIVDAAPPLTDEQRARLGRILRAAKKD